jgi:hypothetical protein
MKLTLFSGAMTASPVPPGLFTFVGPVELPHQLFIDPRCPSAP